MGSFRFCEKLTKQKEGCLTFFVQIELDAPDRLKREKIVLVFFHEIVTKLHLNWTTYPTAKL